MSIAFVFLVILLKTAGAQLEYHGEGVQDKVESEQIKLSRQRRAVGVPEPIGKEERVAGVLRHNEHRSKQGAANMIYMTWNSELARMAQTYVEKCAFEHSSKLTDGYDLPGYKRVGENLHFNTAKVSLASAIDAWYKEIDYYNFADKTCEAGERCGHYTQVVWFRSRMVGCGRALCPTLTLENGETVTNAYHTGCNYLAPGNYGTNRPFAVGESCSDCDAAHNSCKMNACYDTDYGEGPDVDKVVSTSGGNFETTSGTSGGKQNTAGGNDGNTSGGNDETTPGTSGGKQNTSGGNDGNTSGGSNETTSGSDGSMKGSTGTGSNDNTASALIISKACIVLCMFCVALTVLK